MTDSLISATQFFTRRAHAHFFSALALRALDLNLKDPEWPWRFDRAVKLLAIVPKDAFLRGVFFEHTRDGMTAQWNHESFSDVGEGCVIGVTKEWDEKAMLHQIALLQRGESR